MECEISAGMANFLMLLASIPAIAAGLYIVHQSDKAGKEKYRAQEDTARTMYSSAWMVVAIVVYAVIMVWALDALRSLAC